MKIRFIVLLLLISLTACSKDSIHVNSPAEPAQSPEAVVQTAETGSQNPAEREAAQISEYIPAIQGKSLAERTADFWAWLKDYEAVMHANTISNAAYDEGVKIHL